MSFVQSWATYTQSGDLADHPAIPFDADNDEFAIGMVFLRVRGDATQRGRTRRVTQFRNSWMLREPVVVTHLTFPPESDRKPIHDERTVKTMRSWIRGGVYVRIA